MKIHQTSLDALFTMELVWGSFFVLWVNTTILGRWTPDQDSQITFENNDKGVRCAVYREDMVTKTHDGGLKDMRRERKEVWIHPNLENSDCCYVRLIDKYLGLCPPFYKKPNLYLQSRQHPTPAVCIKTK